MFSAAPPGTLNHLHLTPLTGPEQRRALARGLAQAATDDAQTQGLLAQFTGLWDRVRSALDALVALPGQLQQARADLDRVRQTAIEQGQPELAQEAERLFGEVQSREADAAQAASLIQQWRSTWQQIEAFLSGTVGSIGATVEGFFQRIKRAVGLGVLPLLPLAGLIAAVSALGFVAVTGLGVLAWWQITAAKIQGVKDKTLPKSALDDGFFSGLSTPLLIGLGGLISLTVLLTMFPVSGRRR